MKESLKDVYLGWDVEKLEDRLNEKKVQAESAKVIVRSIEEDRKMAYEKTKKKDIGMKSLAGLRSEDKDIAAEIEEEMKAEGIL
jgi:hypothetical protein